ncbi:unnamed protein product, partial [Oikopleura dioica]
ELPQWNQTHCHRPKLRTALICLRDVFLTGVFLQAAASPNCQERV